MAFISCSAWTVIPCTRSLRAIVTFTNSLSTIAPALTGFILIARAYRISGLSRPRRVLAGGRRPGGCAETAARDIRSAPRYPGPHLRQPQPACLFAVHDGPDDGLHGRARPCQRHAGLHKQVEPNAYRMRLLNGSNATAYRISLNNGQPFLVIGTDGVLLEQAITRRTLTLGVGERADVWVDFCAAQSGEEVVLVAQPFAPMMLGDGGMPMMRRPANTGPRPLARFRVGSGAAAKSSLPSILQRFPAMDCAKPSIANGHGESKCR